jgi:hypothetical protein
MLPPRFELGSPPFSVKSTRDFIHLVEITVVRDGLESFFSSNSSPNLRGRHPWPLDYESISFIVSDSNSLGICTQLDYESIIIWSLVSFLKVWIY